MTVRVRSAADRRKEIQVTAAALGIDDAFISELVETFYARTRQHPVLGPIFNDQIGHSWDHHLRMMKDFWASVTMNAGRYSGKPVPAHKKVSAIQPQHFRIWLGLFELTLCELTENSDCIEYFMIRARRIANSLELALFGMPVLGPPRYSSDEGSRHER